VLNHIESRDAGKCLGMPMQECEQVLAMDLVYPQLPGSLYLLGTDINAADIPIAFLP
jgi:hypothetical protein